MRKKSLIAFIAVLLVATGLSAKNYKFKDFTISDGAEDGTWTIVKYNGTDVSVSIPAKINKIEVSKIGKKAFSGNATLESVDIPSTVKFIEDEAFSGCISLNVVNGELEKIGISASAFAGTPYLDKFVIESPKDEYEKYLLEARKYEEEKNWVFALNAYYDAMETSLTASEKVYAFKGFTELAEQIRKGIPGYGEFDIFQVHDEWKKILLEYERLWSLYSPYNVSIGNIHLSEIDYENHTATYHADFNAYVNNRWQKLSSLISDGYSKAYRQDWKGFYSPYDFRENVYYSSVTSNGISWIKYRFKKFTYFMKVVDENGKEIIESREDYNSLIIENVPIEIMKLIDEHKVMVDLKSYSITYEEKNGDEWIEKTVKPRNVPFEINQKKEQNVEQLFEFFEHYDYSQILDDAGK